MAHYFVPQSVLQRLGRCPDPAQHTKKLAEVAVLFVDVQGCSTLCEELPPPTMNRLLERAFGDFFDCVQDAGGDINEIMGDGFMALLKGVHCVRVCTLRRVLPWRFSNTRRPTG